MLHKICNMIILVFYGKLSVRRFTTDDTDEFLLVCFY